MAAGVSAPVELQYATEFLEERFEDGTLRMSVTIDRSRGLRTGLGLAGLTVAASLLLASLWWFTGSFRAGAFALVSGGDDTIAAGAGRSP